MSSGGNKVMVWKVVTSATGKPTLVRESVSAPMSSGQDSGFFTTVTSTGTLGNSQVIWALSRPLRFNNSGLSLYAFDPSTVDSNGQSKTLFTAPAGVWPNGGGNYNMVPVVAGGRVLVASYKQLAIFGLAPAGTKRLAAAALNPEPLLSQTPLPTPHRVFARLTAIDGARLTFETRNGRSMSVDSTTAKARQTTSILRVGRAYAVAGDYDPHGVLQAVSVERVKDSPLLWQDDR